MAFLIQNVFLFKVHLIISNCRILVNISAQKCSDLVESSTFCTLLTCVKIRKNAGSRPEGKWAQCECGVYFACFHRKRKVHVVEGDDSTWKLHDTILWNWIVPK